MRFIATIHIFNIFLISTFFVMSKKKKRKAVNNAQKQLFANKNWEKKYLVVQNMANKNYR